MDVKIVHLPYREHNIGDVVDFGEAKNSSLVSMQRAVWHDPETLEAQKKEAKKLAKKTTQEVKEKEPEIASVESEKGTESKGNEDIKIVEQSAEPAKKPKKKLIENKLKKETSEKTSDKKSFWDKLK